MDTTTAPPELLIGDVATRVGLSVETLRYYDRSGLLGPVQRDTGGRRVFDERSLGVLDIVRRLRRSGMPVEQVRRFAELLHEGDSQRGGRIALLVEHRERLRGTIASLQADLAVVEWKIAAYEADEAGLEAPPPPGSWPPRDVHLPAGTSAQVHG